MVFSPQRLHSPSGFIISSLILLRLQTKLGRKIIFTLSLQSLACVSLLIGLIDLLQDKTIYYYLTLCSRFWQGAATSAFQGAAYAYLAQYMSQMEFAIGTFETCSNIGFMIGPILGSTMYSSYGYQAPFYLLFLLQMLLSGLIYLYFPALQNEVGLDDNLPPRQIQLKKVLLNKRIFLTWLNVMLAYLCISMLEPRLSQFLFDYGVTQNQVGYYFAISAASYGLALPILFTIKSKIDRRSIILLGIFGAATSIYIISSDQINSLSLVSTGLLLLGVSNALQIVPSIRYMIDQSMKINEEEPLLFNDTTNCIGALMNTAFGVGEFTGPFLSGNIRSMSDIFQIFMFLQFGFGLVYLYYSWGSFKTWQNCLQNNHVIVQDIQMAEQEHIMNSQ